MCRLFLKKEYSEFHLQIYDFLKDGPIKADFWRICILAKYGGIYADSDIEPLLPISEFLENDDYFFTVINCNDNPPFYLNPHFIGCEKNNSLIVHCLERYIEKYRNRHTYPYQYWDWSIMKIMQPPELLERKSQILFVDNKKFKFLMERVVKDENGKFRAVTKYNDKNILYGKNLLYKKPR